ncbi:unnamed protein product [Ectocarpus sp. 6 AP-2014]
MNIDIPDLLRALDVDERVDGSGGNTVQGECETIFRLSEKKVPPGRLKKEFLRGYVAIDLALGTLGIPFSKKKLLEKANISKQKAYDDTYQYLRNVLGARVAPMGVSMANIAVKFTGASVERSMALLQRFQDACHAAVTVEHRERLAGRYSTAEYHAAAFCVASVQDKFKLDRKAVAAMVKLQPKDLDKICGDMVAKCGPSELEHAAKVFRVETPGPGDRGQEAHKGKGKRPLSPRDRGGGGGGEESPATATTTRLDELVDGDRSPASPQQSSGRPASGGRRGGGGRTEKRIDFLEAGRASSSVPSHAAVADPAAPLNAFVKRLQRLESKSYAEWCRQGGYA